MKQDRIYEVTRKAIDLPLEYTYSLMEKSKKLRNPSPKVDKIGRRIGACAGVGLVLAGAVPLFMGKHVWAIGTISVGAVTVVSNLIGYYRKKQQK